MKASTMLVALAASMTMLVACGKSDQKTDQKTDPAPAPGTHTHADGSTHDDHGAAEDPHDEQPLPPTTIAGMKVELAQGHGAVEAGKEGHLVVKLPYSDSGSTVVRAWIGLEDRTLSYVGKGLYDPSHDDYDIHATAPDPMPANVMWWIEIQKPDGTSVVGSAAPLLR